MIDFPSRPPTTTQLADWVELNLLFDEDDRISRADVFDVLDDDPDADEPFDHFKGFDWRGATRSEEASLRQEVAQSEAEGQSTTERLVEQAWKELEARARIVGEAYPFAVTGRSVIRQGQQEDCCAYSFLLMLGARLSYGISTEAVPVQRPSILFERTVVIALRNYVGGTVRRFGWPYREDALPGNFRDAAKKLASEMKEAEGQFLTVTEHEKDHGLDVIAWSPFPDERSSQLVILCQCAIGNDWNDKPVHVELWQDIINLAARPLTAVAFVDLASNHPKERVLGVSKVSGILMDRLRLAGLVRDTDLPDDLADEIKKWVEFASGTLPEFR